MSALEKESKYAVLDIEAFNLGKLVYAAGASSSVNPFRKQSMLWRAWKAGWLSGLHDSLSQEEED